MKIQQSGKYVLTGFGTVLVLTGTVSPTALASLTVNINGNGTSSENGTVIEVTQQDTIVQQNSTEVKNDVDTYANTGNNVVSENTGSDIDIETGSITGIVDIVNVTGQNAAAGTACATCVGGTLSINSTANGAESETFIGVTSSTNNSLYQTNTGGVLNDVNTNLNTGYNVSKANVGDTTIVTGDIEAQVALLNKYGLNTYITGPAGSGLDGTITIKGNGADSNTDITITLEQLNQYFQDNNFWIFNDIDQKHSTGFNECLRNVGDCEILTGDIFGGVNVENKGGTNFIGGFPFSHEDPDDTEDTDEEEPTIIDKIIDKIIPKAIAAVNNQITPEESVLGATQLPLTGFGDMPSVALKEILIALYALAAGVYLRNLFGRLERRYAQNVQN